MIRFGGPESGRPDRVQELLKSFELKIEEYKKKKNKLKLDIYDTFRAILRAESDAERYFLTEEAIRIANQLVLYLDEFISFQRKNVAGLKKFPIDQTIIDTFEKNIPIYEKEREDELKTIETLKKTLKGRDTQN